MTGVKPHLLFTVLLSQGITCKLIDPEIPQMITVDKEFIAPFNSKQSQTESEASITFFYA